MRLARMGSCRIIERSFLKTMSKANRQNGIIIKTPERTRKTPACQRGF